MALTEGASREVFTKFIREAKLSTAARRAVAQATNALLKARSKKAVSYLLRSGRNITPQ